MLENASPELARNSAIVPRTRATLSDLLERVLEKGLILDADIVIVLAGIPLIGVKLKAAIAGIETMRKYGLMVDWDHKTREEYRKAKTSQLASAERLVSYDFRH